MVWAWIAVGAYSLIVLAWLGRWLELRFRKPKIPILRYDAPALPLDQARFVSIIVPARNESANIGACLSSLLALDYPRFEVIVVDDRSTDNTAEIVRRFMGKDSRVRLMQVDELPPGWTGKTHALHSGVALAKGAWLLFVDADTTLHRRNLSVLLRYAVAEEADMVSLIPGQRCESFWEKIVQPVAGITLLIYYWLPKVNDTRLPDYAFANGQYILVRRRPYMEMGGHEGVKGDLLEDIALVRRVKKNGGSLRVVVTPLLTVTRMYTSLKEIIRGWSRIFYAAVSGHPWRLLASLCFLTGLHLSAYILTLAAALLLLCGVSSPFLWAFLGLGLAHQGGIVLVMRHLYRFGHNPRWHILGYPLACIVMMAIMIRALQLSFTHKVTWRGTTYGPETLRKAA